MRFVVLAVLLSLYPLASAAAAPKALFDNTKAETAGNADWVIDNDQPVPSPAPSGITWATPESYWTGGVSAWGVQLVKRGYTVASLTTAYGITYKNPANAHDLSNYDLFIVDEPNIRFSAAESTAIFDFVREGGGLIAIGDHYNSDRNNDGYDSPVIWNLLDAQHLWGVHFAVSGEANNNVVQTSFNVSSSPTDSIIRGPAGTATSIAYHNGATMTLYPAVNPTVRGNVWLAGLPEGSTTGVMVAQSVYGNGRIVFVGDSSPADDGTANPGNTVYNGWAESGGSDSLIFLNASLWATRRAAPADVSPPTVSVLSPAGGEDWKAGSAHAVTWTATDDVAVTAVDLAYSSDGGASYPYTIATGLPNSGAFTWTLPATPTATARLRVTAHDAAGHASAAASAADFAIGTWTITAVAGAGGGISPSGAVAVTEGANQDFAIAPVAGYAVLDVLVDRASVGAVPSYAFASVAADHTIAASFLDVAAPAVRVTAPVGGEVWSEGDVESITWTATDNAAVDSVDLDVSFGGAGGPWAAVAHGLVNTGAYAWTVPAQYTDSAWVRVTARDAAGNSATDASDSAFAIANPLVGVDGSNAPLLALAPPAPNPGRGVAQLRFTLPAAGRVRLEILDLAGRLVWHQEGELPAGVHAARWAGETATGTRAGAGLYFVRLVTPWGTRAARLARLP